MLPASFDWKIVLDPFEVFDVSLPPHRLVILPAYLAPAYMDVDPDEDLKLLRFLLDSAEMSIISGPVLRAHALAWPGVQIEESEANDHAIVVERILRAVEEGVLVAAIGDEQDLSNPVTEAEIREVGARARPVRRGTASTSVGGMGYTDKLMLALEMLPEAVGREVGAQVQREVEQFLTPANIAMTAGVMIVWAGSHAVGVGFVVSGVLLGTALVFAGWEALEAFRKIGKFFEGVESARSEQQRREATKHLAQAIGILGIAGFKALLRKVTPKRQRGSASGGQEGGTSISGMERGRSGPTGTPLDSKTKPSSGDGGTRPPGAGSSGAGSGGAKPAARPRPVPKRLEYLGATPRKTSRTGREVREKWRVDPSDPNPPVGAVRYNRRRRYDEFKGEDGNWYKVDSPTTHMGHHPKDAVDYWNETGRFHGAKSKEVRDWMLDSDNYRFEHGPLNSARGGQTKSRYKPPVK